MKKKRFKHQVESLCRIFCGWQICNDYNVIAKLSDGKLSINALNGECVFNNTSIRQLSMGGVLNNYIKDDLAKNNISIDDLGEALLKVLIKIKLPEYGSRFTNFIFNCNGKESYGVRLELNKMHRS